MKLADVQPLCAATSTKECADRCQNGLCWWFDGPDLWAVWVVKDIAYTLKGGAGEMILELGDEAP